MVRLNVDTSLLLLLMGDVNLNPGPGVLYLHLRTVKGYSMCYRPPALSELMTCAYHRPDWPLGKPQQIWLKRSPSGYLKICPKLPNKWMNLDILASETHCRYSSINGCWKDHVTNFAWPFCCLQYHGPHYPLEKTWWVVRGHWAGTPLV